MTNRAHILTQYQSEYHVWTIYCKNCGAEGIALSAPCPGDKLSNLVKEHIGEAMEKGSYSGELTTDQVNFLQERADETRKRWTKALDLGKERS